MRTWIAIGFLMLGAVSWAQEMRPMGEGLPLPWPFPWAKDCPVSWESMQGRYVLLDSDRREQLDLAITVENQMGKKTILITRFDEAGKIPAQGSTTVRDSYPGRPQVTGDTRIEVILHPVDSLQPVSATRAALALFYVSESISCRMENLVPILTLEDLGASSRKETQYRLIKVDRSKN